MNTLRRIPFWGALALLIYMPFHVFLSQSISLLTGGLDAWKLAKDGMIAILTVFIICLTWQQRRRPCWFIVLIVGTSLYAALHIVLWVLHPHLFRDSALLGSIYNVRIPCLLIIGAGAGLLWPEGRRWIWPVVIGVSTLVAVLGIVQYFLPKDILTHVGYSLERGVRPNFFIDDNPAFPRAMSTLRDPNSLGAYLLVPLAALSAYALRLKSYPRRRQIGVVALLAVHFAALYVTFSRSAWLGAAVTLLLVLAWQFGAPLVRLARRYWPVAIAAVAVLTLVAVWQRHNPQLDGIVSHSTAAQVGPHDSNDLHWLYVRRGIEGIIRSPLGHGPGTAGLASIQNPTGGLLTENYYVQIGYELGVVGLLLFIALNVWIYMRLWKRHDLWATVLLSSFWGYVIMNMLLHTWSNEAVAAQWWIVAGIALVPLVAVQTKKQARR